MRVLVDADDHVDSSGDLAARIEGVVEGSLEPYADRIARVNVRLSQLSRQEAAGDQDMRCRMEALAPGLAQTIAVVHDGLTLTEAIHAAAAKLEQAVRQALTRPGTAASAEPADLGHLRRS